MSASNHVKSLNVVSCTVNGAGMFVSGYIATFVLFILTGATLKSFFVVPRDALPQIVAWLFFGAHNVPVTAGGQTFNFLAQEASLAVVYYLVPIGVLAATGYYLAGRQEMTHEPIAGAVAGAGQLVGYLPLAIVGAFTASATVGETVIAPSLLWAIVGAGVVYPVVFGGLGGVIAALRA